MQRYKCVGWVKRSGTHRSTHEIPKGRRFLNGGLHFVAPTLLGLLICAVAGAANVNGLGASLNLSTTDLSSGSVQTNEVGARVFLGGTPDIGVVSANTGVISADVGGAKLIIEPMNAIAVAPSPVANFSAYPVHGAPPLSVQFTDASSGGLYDISAWSWDFGDGTPTSTEQNPTHVYDAAGTYTVSLTITTSGGTFTTTRTDYITVSTNVPTTTRSGMLLLALALVLTGTPLSAQSFRRDGKQQQHKQA